jgi:alpha-ketoglutarate-dependent taurine dioxygenase
MQAQRHDPPARSPDAQPSAGYRLISVRAATGALGAEIDGVDLTRALSAPLCEEILRAFREHLVIWFQNQDLSASQHIGFAQLFGPLQRIPHLFSVEGHPELQIVRRLPEETSALIGESWHSDSTYLATPPSAVVMRAVEVPDHGGDTAFANLYLAYETLSPGMQQLLCGMKSVHSARRLFGSGANQERFAMRSMPTAEGDREVAHPLVRTHPISGRKALFVNSTYTQRIAELTQEESRPLLEFLYAHAARIEFTCRVRWRRNMLLVWDNRCTHHRAIADYQGQYRYMQRVTTGGEVPV